MTAADAGAILSFPIGYRGFTLNEHRTSGGAITAANVENTVMVEKFDFSPLEFRDQRDGLHLLMGGDLGMVSDQFRYVSIAGIIKGSSAALLEDRVAKFLSAFHPVNCFAASPTTRGVHDLDFYCPTATPPSGYSSPVRELFKGRPTGLPAVFERRGSGYQMQFAAQLICPDTRRYLYTAEAKVANAGNAWSIAVPNWTSALGAPTTGIVTLELTGAGSSNCTLWYADTLTGVTTVLVLDLSGLGVGAHTITVDVQNNIIKEGSTRKDSLRTSAVDTGFWQVNAGGGTFSVPAGRTNLTSATFASRQARA
jgi:hypothetical protein